MTQKTSIKSETIQKRLIEVMKREYGGFGLSILNQKCKNIGVNLEDVKEQDLTTPNFDALLMIMERVSNDTDTLLKDIQTLNPYAREQRQIFRKMLDEIETEIGGN